MADWESSGGSVGPADAVGPDREVALGGDLRVELAQRAGSGVPRVRGELLALLGEALVQPVEGRDGEVDLAAHLERPRVLLAVDGAHAERDRLDRAQVRGHVLPALAVAARRAADELTVLVHERDRGAVDLRLGDVRDGLIGVEPLAHVVRPLLERLVGRHLLERPHRGEVVDFAELVRRRGADALRRRVGRDEVRMLLLERLQLVEEPVVVGVRDLRIVEDVVAVQVVLDLLAQLGSTLLDGLGWLCSRGHRGAAPASRPARRLPRARRPGGCSPTPRRR